MEKPEINHSYTQGAQNEKNNGCDLRNEDNICRILEEGSQEELEKLREFYDFSSEEMMLHRDFAILRKEVHKNMSNTFRERILSNPEPSQEEESLCVYREEIEPHVLSAVILMRKKGYDTYESGFYGLNKQRIGFNDSCLDGFELPFDVIEFAKTKEVEIKIGSDNIEYFCNKFLSTEEIKEIWEKIAEALPDLNSPINIDIKKLESFRNRVKNIKENPSRFFD